MRRRRHLPLSCCLLLSFALPAQIAAFADVDALTLTAGGVAAAPLTPDLDAWPGVARSVTSSAGSGAVTMQHTLDDVEVGVLWQLSANAVGDGAVALHANVRYELFSVPQDGELIVEWLVDVDDDASASLHIDLGDDGVVDATGSATIPLAFGLQPFALRVWVDANAVAGTFQGPWGSSWSWDSSFEASLRVRFVPTHATATPLAPPTCAPAPELSIRADLLQGVQLRAQTAAPADLVLFALGFAPAAAPLPASAGCALLVEPVATLWAPVSADGAATVSVAVPPAVRPAQFDAQAIAVDLQPFGLRASGSARSSVF